MGGFLHAPVTQVERERAMHVSFCACPRADECVNVHAKTRMHAVTRVHGNAWVCGVYMLVCEYERAYVCMFVRACMRVFQRQSHVIPLIHPQCDDQRALEPSARGCRASQSQSVAVRPEYQRPAVRGP